MQILRKILRGHFYHSGQVTNRVSCSHKKKNGGKRKNQSVLLMVRNHENKFENCIKEQLVLHILRNVMYFATLNDRKMNWVGGAR